MMPNEMYLNALYKWKHQPEILVYIGPIWDPTGKWHQFVLADSPRKVWCEVRDADLKMIERVPG